MSTREPLDDRLNRVGNSVRDMGREVWLASLGAVGSIDERGRAVFTDLVDRGEKVDGKIDLDVRKPIVEAKDRVKTFGARVERQVEDGMASTLHRLGMPARHDVSLLIERVERLTRQVEGLAAGR